MAQDINKVTLIGNLCRDCGANERDFGYAQSGMCIAKISIANNRLKKQADGNWGEEVSYFDVNIYGKTAENLKPYLKKGVKVCIAGTLKQERWQDRQTNENRSRIVINADEVQLLGGNQQNQGFNPNKVYNSAQEAAQAANPYSQPTPPKRQAPQQNDLGLQEDYPYDFPEDIPF